MQSSEQRELEGRVRYLPSRLLASLLRLSPAADGLAASSLVVDFIAALANCSARVALPPLWM